MRIYALIFAAFLLTGISNAAAQLSSQKDAMYVATLKAVANYKIDDEELSRDIERLRKNRRFNEDLQRMMEKLSNRRSKNSTNKKVLEILEKAGEDIYNELK